MVFQFRKTNEPYESDTPHLPAGHPYRHQPDRLRADCGTDTANTATTPPAVKPAEKSALEDFIAQSKHPVSWFTWGMDMRVRNEYFNNAQIAQSERLR